MGTPPIRSAVSLTALWSANFSPPLKTRCSRKWAMPFSSGRSVRAPASKATRAVTARVPSMFSFTSGRPVSRVVVSVEIIGATLARGRRRPYGRGGGRRPSQVTGFFDKRFAPAANCLSQSHRGLKGGRGSRVVGEPGSRVVGEPGGGGRGGAGGSGWRGAGGGESVVGGPGGCGAEPRAAEPGSRRSLPPASP